MIFFLFFESLAEDSFIDFRERGRERKGEIKININVRNVDLLLPAHAPTGDRTQNLSMCFH